VIALADLIHTTPDQLTTRHLLDSFNGLEHGNAVFPTSAKVVDLAGPWFGSKLLDGPYHVAAMNVVANLFAFVSKHGITPTAHGRFHEVGEKPVKFYP
jgi:hypothetical protein